MAQQFDSVQMIDMASRELMEMMALPSVLLLRGALLSANSESQHRIQGHEGHTLSKISSKHLTLLCAHGHSKVDLIFALNESLKNCAQGNYCQTEIIQMLDIFCPKSAQTSLYIPYSKMAMAYSIVPKRNSISKWLTIVTQNVLETKEWKGR